MRTTKTRQEDYIGLYTRYEIKVKVTINKILGGRDAIALVCIFRCWPIEIGPSRYKLMHWSWSSFLFARSIPAGGRHTCKPYSHLISDCQLASVQARNQVGQSVIASLLLYRPVTRWGTGGRAPVKCQCPPSEMTPKNWCFYAQILVTDS